MKKKKTWVRSKEQSLICGYCETCNKQLMSDEGGWIITANKQYFCHNGKDGSCFDKHCGKNETTKGEQLCMVSQKVKVS